VATAISGHGQVLEPAHGEGHDDGHGADHGYDPHHGSMGVDTVKLLMWSFIASECLLFGTLIAAFLAYFNKGIGPHPHEVYDIPYTSVSAFVLLLSSLTMVLALAAAQANDQRQLRIWLVATALLGMVFIGGQFFEFTTFKTHEHVWIDTNQFGSTFFLLTGFHGFHVTMGAIMLSVVLYRVMKGHFTPEHHFAFEGAAWYWHFVDVVWLGLYVVVYWL
jgi:heme/copper-type cytochrome/quinol oxidase subunit 3